MRDRCDVSKVNAWGSCKKECLGPIHAEMSGHWEISKVRAMRLRFLVPGV